jgi:hypothetical protein
MASLALIGILLGLHVGERLFEFRGHSAVRLRHADHLLCVPIFLSRSIAQAITASLRASATAAFFLRVFCLPQIRS